MNRPIRALPGFFLLLASSVLAQDTLYFTTASGTDSEDRVMSVLSDTTSPTTLVSGASNFASPSGIDYDPGDELFFVGDGFGGEQILQWDKTFTTRTPVATGLVGGVQDVAVDAANNLIYFLTAGVATADRLTRMGYDGMGQTDLATGSAGDFVQPVALALDLVNSYIFVADFDFLGGGKIIRFDLDGSNRSVIYAAAASTAGCNGVATDPITGIVYFTTGSGTAANDGLHRVDNDGMNHQSLASGAANFEQPGDVLFDPENSYLYVVDSGFSSSAGLLRFSLSGTGRAVIHNPSIPVFDVVRLNPAGGVPVELVAFQVE